jgi:hypothetical protein
MGKDSLPAVFTFKGRHSMTVEQQNKAIYRRIPLEMFNTGNLVVADEVFAADYVEHAVASGLSAPLDGLKQFVAD